MVRPHVRSASYDSTNFVEVDSNALRDSLLRMRGLPVLWPVEIREDAAHNVIARLLAEAKRRGMDLGTLVKCDPKVVQQKIEAERSRVRRERSKLGHTMSEEMAEVLPADLALPESLCGEIIQQAAQAAGLSAQEAKFVHLFYACGIDDYGILSTRMSVRKDQLYRLHNKARKKLQAIPDVIGRILERYEHPSQPNPSKDGTWRRFPGRCL